MFQALHNCTQVKCEEHSERGTAGEAGKQTQREQLAPQPSELRGITAFLPPEKLPVVNTL